LTVDYAYERPDRAALEQLERVLDAVGEELAGWRRRSLKAEAELQEAKALGGAVAGPALKEARQRVVDLETENLALSRRIEATRDRLRMLTSRLAFLEEHSGGNAA
jgi:predicted RNase H-like nuclease (RuvC/YqgF family)